MILELCDAVVISENYEAYFFVLEEYKIKIKKTKEVKDFAEKIIKSHFIDTDEVKDDNIRKLVEKFKEKHILLMPLDSLEDINYNNLRFLSYIKENPIEIQKKLAEKNICIIGLGGVGQIVLQHLAAAGFRRFITIDFDVVHVTNLNRQFLVNKSQIGNDKIDSVKEYMKNCYDDIDIKKISKMITSETDLDEIFSCYDINMLICAADRPQNGLIKKIVTRAAIKYDVPCIFGAVGINIGEIGPLLTTRKGKEKYCTVLNTKKEKKYSDVLSGSICFTNSLVSIILAYEVYKYFAGIDSSIAKNKIVLLEFNSLKTTTISIG